MGSKLNLKFERNKIIAIGTLASLCVTTVCTYSMERASASIGRVGNSVGRLGITSSNLGRTGKSSHLSTGLKVTPKVSSKIGTNGKNITTPTNQTSLTELERRLVSLEVQKDLEKQKSKHPLTKTLVVSGVISGSMLVAGVIGGIIQQSNFRGLGRIQAENDQDIQEDLTKKRYYFQEKEIPEAEQYIIDYYKDNFGIDITRN